MSETFKRHAISAGVTFVSVFLITVIPVFLDPTFTFEGAVVTSLLLTGARSGVKAVWETILPKLQS